MADEICKRCESRIFSPTEVAARVRRTVYAGIDAANATSKDIGDMYRAFSNGVNKAVDVLVDELEEACHCHLPSHAAEDGPDDADDDHGLDSLYDQEFDEGEAA